MKQSYSDGRYDSIMSFLDSLQGKASNARNQASLDGFISGERSPKWYGAGCKNGTDVIKIMREGWQEGMARMNDLKDKIGNVDLAPVDMRRRPMRLDRGDHLDIMAVYNGRFDICWRTARRQTVAGPQRVDIIANMVCSGGEHADVLFWRGAAAATLADILEQAGYMVRLVVGFGGEHVEYRGNKIHASCRITVKDHGMPFDIASTSAVILPGFFRALGHAWLFSHATFQHSDSGIYPGVSVIEEGEILASHEIRDHGTAVAWIRDNIARLNADKAA